MLDHNAPNFLFFLEYSFHFFCWRVCESFHCVCVYYRKERANVTILMGLIWLRFNLTVLKWRHFGHICSATLESYCCSNHCSKCTTAIQLFHTRNECHWFHLSDLCVKFYFHSCCTQSLCLLLTAEEMESVCLQLISWSVEVPILKALAMKDFSPKGLAASTGGHKCTSVIPFQSSTCAPV